MHLILTLLLFIDVGGWIGGAPSSKQGTFAFTNARIVSVANGTIEEGTLVVRQDTIAAVGSDVTIPSDAQIIDCSGLTIYPGMIDAGTRLGLMEVGSLSETHDYRELGSLTPQMEALTAVNPNSVHIPVTRVNGVTTVITEPTGGILPGSAALINLHGYTPDQMHVGGFEAVVMDYPSMGRRGSWDDRSQKEIENEAHEALDRLNEIWDRAELYASIDSAYAADPNREEKPEYVPQMKALAPVIRGEQPLIVKADAAQDIVSALEWIDRRSLERVILSGVAEGWRVADQIAEADVPCLVGPVLSRPTRAYDRYDKPYANAGLLHRAGVEVAIRTGEAENVRNLPYHAGFAAAYGLGREEALRAVTLTPARIFGVGDVLGSLEVGKQATLFVTDGDPFETSTNIRHLLIEGYKLPLESRQTRLYNEFLNRTPGLEQQDSVGEDR